MCRLLIFIRSTERDLLGRHSFLFITLEEPGEERRGDETLTHGARERERRRTLKPLTDTRDRSL